jgi:hypothetical protein
MGESAGKLRLLRATEFLDSTVEVFAGTSKAAFCAEQMQASVRIEKLDPKVTSAACFDGRRCRETPLQSCDRVFVHRGKRSILI